MVVGEEKNIVQDIKRLLEQDHFQVVAVDNSRKALELIEEDNEEKFGLILISTKIPDSDKPAFFSMKPKSKMNIDTTKSDDFLQKPFTREELLDFVKRKI